jgi:hypothetical protein
MDEAVIKRMKEVEAAVMDLDVSVRGEAFTMMKAYILGEADNATPSPTGTAHSGSEAAAEPVGDLEAFFANRDVDKPADAVFAIAGYLYGRYGTEPFTTSEIKGIADEVGLTVPSRIDMTLGTTRRGGKALFRSAGKRKFAPTVLGEKTLKEELNITKGKMKRATGAEADAEEGK